MNNSLHAVRYLKTLTDPGTLELCTAEIALVGRSNVGKSSLLNAVCGRRPLARTSPVPGKTRTINVFAARNGVWIVDLPGYGYAAGPASERAGWKDMIEGYLLGRASLRMVFMLVDANVGPTALDRQMALWLQSQALPYCVIANKIDKVAAAQQLARRAEVAGDLERRPEDIYWVSALKNQGIDVLARAMTAILDL
jgi:GTP-binding protein